MAEQVRTGRRNQRHGIDNHSITVSLAGDEVERLRREASESGESLSRVVANLIADGRKARDLMRMMVAAERSA